MQGACSCQWRLRAPAQSLYSEVSGVWCVTVWCPFFGAGSPDPILPGSEEMWAGMKAMALNLLDRETPAPAEKKEN